MRSFFAVLISFFCLLGTLSLKSQTRTYAPASVLAEGAWYKISVSSQGVYKVDGNMLSKMGISLPFPSAQLRLFGNGGKMLPEANSKIRPDDLKENAIIMEDGGDGSFGLQDHFIFYAPGPNAWNWDSLARRYVFQKNIYSDSAWYFINIGSQGKRVTSAPVVLASQINTEVDAVYAYELDETNFLQSGKEWYGEEFGTGFGRTTTRDFTIPVQHVVPNSPMIISIDVLGRTVGVVSRFEISLNNSPFQQIILPSFSGAVYDPVGSPMVQTSVLPAPSTTLKLTLQFVPGNSNAQGWLNRFEWNGRIKLDMRNLSQLHFRDKKNNLNQTVRYAIDNAPTGTRVLDVTDFLNPIEQNLTRTGTTIYFNAHVSSAREYVAFTPEQFLSPIPGPRIPNQNLHGAANPNYIIVTHPIFKNDANRIGRYHLQKRGLRYLIADVQQIYNEFSSGSPDPTAIRDFVKMFYDRAAGDSMKIPQYLLLLGDASYDYKNRISSNTNLVPGYQSSSSLDILTTYTSDDYFGFLDDYEDINATTSINLLDIGIGRIPVVSVEESGIIADKIENYSSSYGPWRTQFTIVADDEDQNVHFKDAEDLSKTIQSTNNVFHQQKIYLDAYPQVSGAGGARYPLVNEEINRYIYNGNLIWNYSGHGGYKRLAEEAILEESMINTWQNKDRLPLFITATCDFAPFDNPQIKSIGEKLFLKSNGGAIALMTTTRAVFAFANKIINTNYLSTALAKQQNGRYLSLGDAVKRSKNYTYQNMSDAINNRKFTLIGDPALVLGFPENNVVTTSINGIEVSQFTDTLRALNKYTIDGEVRDQLGGLKHDFNGTVYTTFYDKVQERSTRGNDAGSSKASFLQQQNILFKGKAEVVKGRFTFSFIVPKDIDLRNGLGRLSYYAENGLTDAAGTDQRWYIGGLGGGIQDDRQGPLIKAYLNDDKFVNGGIVNQKSVLLVALSDTSGLNVAGTGIGHDLIAILDDDVNKIFVLNDFFEADKGSYKQGRINFPLPVLEEGLHYIKIRAWDVFNNPSEVVLTFRVIHKPDFELKNVRCYPNPFTAITKISFEHNRNNEELDISVKILNAAGNTIRRLQEKILTVGNRFELSWNGANESGVLVQPGVYIYQIIVNSSDGRLQKASGKLIKY